MYVYSILQINFNFCATNFCKVCETLIITKISCCEPVINFLYYIVYCFAIVYILYMKNSHHEPVYLGKLQNKVIMNKSWFTVYDMF